MNPDRSEHSDQNVHSVTPGGLDSSAQSPVPGHYPGPGHGWIPGPGGYPQPYVLRRPTNNLAIAALIVSLVSLVSCQLIGAIGIYLGSRARAEIRASGEDGDGLALAGIVVGWCAIGMAVLSILLVVVYISIIGIVSS